MVGIERSESWTIDRTENNANFNFRFRMMVIYVFLPFIEFLEYRKEI